MTLTSVNALTLTDGTATMQMGGTGATTLSGATTLDVDSTGALSINSSGGAINVGDDANTGAINIGSGASARTITVGNDASTKVDVNATEIELDAGTGGIALNSESTSTTEAIKLASSAGGMQLEIAANSDSQLRLRDSDGKVNLNLYSHSGGVNDALHLTVTDSTKVNAIQLAAALGGLNFDAGSQVTIDAGTTIALTSTDALTLTDGTATLSLGGTGATSISGATTLELDATAGVTIDTTNTSDGIKLGTSTSGVPITIGHGTSEVTVADNLTVAGTASVTSDATVGGNLVVTGNMTVNGTTTTISTTNTTVSDSLMELSSGTSGTPANDAGLIIERGSSDNAFIGWDESADKFIVGTTTATGADTGDLSVTAGTLVANLEGNVTGDLTGDVTGNVTGNVTGDLTGSVLTATQNSITTMTGLVSVGTSGTDTEFAGRVVANDLSMGGAISMGGHIIPASNAAYDLGNAEYKIRHLFLSDNSVWIGDKYKIDVSGGRLKFKEANLAKVPMPIKIAYGGDESAAQTAAEAATSPGRNKALSAFTLNDWLLFAQASGQTINGSTGTEISYEHIFDPHGENYTVDAAGDIGFSDLSFNSTTVLDICGNINLPPSSIPSSAIIGGVGSNDFTNDVTMSNRLFVARDLSFNQRIFIGGDISMNMGSYIHQF